MVARQAKGERGRQCTEVFAAGVGMQILGACQGTLKRASVAHTSESTVSLQQVLMDKLQRR